MWLRLKRTGLIFQMVGTLAFTAMIWMALLAFIQWSDEFFPNMGWSPFELLPTVTGFGFGVAALVMIVGAGVGTTAVGVSERMRHPKPKLVRLWLTTPSAF
jgi:hypothetical protein